MALSDMQIKGHSQSVYRGRSARLRGVEHLKEREKSVLYKHNVSDHPNEDLKFKMEMTQKLPRWCWRKRKGVAKNSQTTVIKIIGVQVQNRNFDTAQMANIQITAVNRRFSL